MNAKIKRCLKPESLPAVDGTVIVHVKSCRDSSALFRILPSGALQHTQSGLCIHLLGKDECPRKGSLAVLKEGKFHFTCVTVSSSFILPNFQISLLPK